MMLGRGCARMLGLQSTTIELRRAEDFVPVFDTIKGQAEALYVCLDPLFNANRIGSPLACLPLNM
jgi:hypothetical protein